jgi:hypothetical protein
LAQFLFRAWLVGGAIAFTAASPRSALADPPKAGPQRPLSQSLTGAAKADFESAKLLANDGDFAGALIKFQSAYDASKDVRLLWNVAFCQKNMRRYSKVVTTLHRYIDEGATTLSAADKKDAQDLIATIEPFTTRATVRVSEPGAQIFIDDEAVGTSPLPAPVILDLGERHVRVVKEGFKTFEKATAIGGAADVTIDVPLEREVHEGRIAIDAPAGAAVFIDDKQVGTGKVEQTVSAGGHQLRVTAPGLRPFQTEVVIGDKETRALNVVLEADVAPVKPTLRVAVGCGDTTPRTDDGTVVYVDGPDVLPPTIVKSHYSQEEGGNVIDRIEFATNPGHHTFRVTSTNCYGYDIDVDVDPIKGADISGALDSSRPLMFRGPQGSPGWFQASLGLWLAGGEVNKNGGAPDQYQSRGITVVGPTLEVGFVGRWFGYYLSFLNGTGSFNRQSRDSLDPTLPESAGVKWNRELMRFGPRFPFNVVSFGFGPELGVEQLEVDKVRQSKTNAVFGGYFEMQFEPFCDWGVWARGGGDANDTGAGSYGVQFGAMWAPSPTCRKERDTQFGLKAQPPR